MEIGGKDTIVILDLAQMVRLEVKACISDHWPAIKHESDGNEYFYYENEKAKAMWNRYGRTGKAADQMIHIIYEVPHRVTIVTDGPKTEAICEDLRQVLSGEAFRTKR